MVFGWEESSQARRTASHICKLLAIHQGSAKVSAVGPDGQTMTPDVWWRAGLALDLRS